MNEKYFSNKEQIQNWAEFKKESVMKTNNARKAKLMKG